MSFSCLLAAPAFAQITGGTCSASNLNGTYSINLSGRALSAVGNLSGTFEGNGLATFDGVGKVTFTGTVNTNLALGKSFTYSGTYTVPSNCYGTITLTAGSSATFTLVVYNGGKDFNITGSDSTFVYSGGGNDAGPQACVTATLSGPYTYDSNGPTLSGTTETGSADEAGILQFDGQGKVTASYTITASGTTPQAITASGTYSVTSGCLATATLTDSTGKTNTLNFVIEGAYGQTLAELEANAGFIRVGTAHSAFLNPTATIANVFSYAVNATPPGSVFVLYGTDLATKPAGATSTPFPTTLLTTKVTVNGEGARHIFHPMATADKSPAVT